MGILRPQSSRATTDLQFLKIFKTKLVSRTLRTVAVKLLVRVSSN